MSAQHTPGRLESKTHTYGIADTGDYDSIFEIWGGEKVIAWFGGEDTDEANARRLVACWNACEGITDPENVVPRLLALNELVPDLEHQAATLRVQRDELLAALEGLTGDIQALIGESDGVAGLHMNGDVAPWGELEAGGRFERLTHLPTAHAAIAKVKGGQYERSR